LPVVVVDPITVRIAIRAVQIYDDSGMLRNHCSEAVDPPTELDRMNKIWTHQAQIKFELVPSQPAIINDRNPVIQKVIADGLGLKDTSLARVPAIVEASKLKELFRPLKVSGAQATFFIVDRIADGEGRPNGITFADDAMIYIARSRDQSTFAHEAGHFLGRKHTSEMIYNERTKQFVLADEDYRMLMRDGGAGAKIPFNLIREFRSRCSQGSERK
jgi:hypothetical protein